VITARSTDVGALINAGGGSGAELFHVANTRRLRVQVRVPEVDAAGVRVGAKALLSVPDRPGQRFEATISRTARAIDPVSRTLLVELEVDNRSGALLAGAFAEVRLPLSEQDRALRLPSAALQFRSDGVQVATLGADGRVAFRKIVLGRDLGREVEVLDGIRPEDQVVLDPPDSLAEGERVRVLPSAQRADGSRG
jgi:RND family efflux transporter MFP subunit